MQENNTLQPANIDEPKAALPVASVPTVQPKNNNLLIVLLSLLLVVSVAISTFFAFQTQKIVKELNTLKSEQKAVVTPSPIALATAEPVATDSAQLSGMVVLNNFQDGDTITNPFKISGTIDRSWTFEGVFSIEILDSDKKSLTIVPVNVVPAGDTAKADSFSVSIPFVTTAKSGYLVIHADNPSGLPANDKSVEYTVSFSN